MPDEEVELIDYLRVIAKRRRLIVVGTLTCILAFFLEYLEQAKHREQR